MTNKVPQKFEEFENKVPCTRHQRNIAVNVSRRNNELPKELEEGKKEVLCTRHKKY